MLFQIKTIKQMSCIEVWAYKMKVHIVSKTPQVQTWKKVKDLYKFGGVVNIRGSPEKIIICRHLRSSMAHVREHESIQMSVHQKLYLLETIFRFKRFFIEVSLILKWFVLIEKNYGFIQYLKLFPKSCLINQTIYWNWKMVAIIVFTFM